MNHSVKDGSQKDADGALGYFSREIEPPVNRLRHHRPGLHAHTQSSEAQNPGTEDETDILIDDTGQGNTTV